MVWIIEEHEGYTDRLVKTERFKTQEEAIERWDTLRSMSRFAGVGGKWKHYYTYPEEE